MQKLLAPSPLRARLKRDRPSPVDSAPLVPPLFTAIAVACEGVRASLRVSRLRI